MKGGGGVFLFNVFLNHTKDGSISFVWFVWLVVVVVVVF